MLPHDAMADGDRARAWYGITYWLLLDGGFSNDRTLLYKAESELRRALDDDQTLARAHAGFAAIYLMQGRKEAEVERARETNPGDADASINLMTFHIYSGEFAIALRVGEEVLDRNPLYFPIRTDDRPD
ncbi:MAG: tetratricopeptide repeat protein [Acidobacteriota bacterium]